MVKIREVKHSDEELSSGSGSQEEYGEEELSYGSQDMMNPFEDMAEDGEEEFDDEEGEMDMMEDISDISDGSSDKPVKAKKVARQISDSDDSSDKPVKAKKAAKPVSDSDSDDEEIAAADRVPDLEDDEDLEDLEDLDGEDEPMLNEEEFKKARLEKFGLKAIYNKPEIQKRLYEVKQSFYNRLESRKLIKKHGRVPFTEHMTITHPNPIGLSERAKSLSINDDIKREVAIYNQTRENVQKAMEFCVQAKVPISRPDDFLAEMLKSDDHMKAVKARLLKQ